MMRLHLISVLIAITSAMPGAKEGFIDGLLEDPLPIVPTLSCPEPFKNVGDSCYGIVGRTTGGQEAAETFCQAFGGHLAILDSRTEIELISRYMDDVAPNCQGIDGPLIWLAARGTDSDYIWEPEDEYSTVNFTNWNLGAIVPEDPTDTGITMDCSDFSGYTWFPEDITVSHSALCEIDPISQSESAPPAPLQQNWKDRSLTKRPDTLLSFNIQPPTSCGGSETAIGDRCYIFFDDFRANYATATQICANFGGHLLYLETRSELELMVRYLNKEYPNCEGMDVPDQQKFLWTGASSTNYPSVPYKWGPLNNVIYSLWKSPNPDLNGGVVGVILDCTQEYYWIDYPVGNNVAVPFICEIN